MKYSIIIPVYNRPDEVDELLESLSHQSLTDFEVIVVEDGSTVPCDDVCRRHSGKLPVTYYAKPNSGPGQSRNYGAERAAGEYLIVLDSDVVLPEGYLQAVDDELSANPCEAFGGPDRSHDSFTTTQKAISYSMTSFFTTGGIRGGKKKLDKFYPRSFNMGIRRDVYSQLGGFSKMRFGEDIDFSIRIFESGARCRLFPGAWVWHKRRTDLRKFWRQVYNSGIARINLHKRHPGSLKAVHLLPAVFTLGEAACAIAAVACLAMHWLCDGDTPWLTMAVAALLPPAVYSLLLLADSTVRNKSLKVGLTSVPAAFVQLTGYGCGFLQAWWRRCVRGMDEFQAYEKTFYK